MNDVAVPVGGAEIMVFTLRDALRQRGHDARIFASTARPVAAASQADYECFGTTSRARGLVQSINPWAAVALRRVLREFRPDIVHVTMFLTQLSPLILPVLRGIPAVYHAAWYRYVCLTGTKLLPDFTRCGHRVGTVCVRAGCIPVQDWAPLMAQHGLARRWRDVFGTILALSDAVRDRLVAEGIAVDDIVPAPIPVRDARPPLQGPPTVLFAGRLVPEKGVHVLLDAFSRVLRELPEARLTIIGSGPAHSRLETIRRELGLSSVVEMRPHLPREALESAADTAWVQVVPSIWEEPFGLAVAEGMMRGTAVVASRSGGIPSVLGDIDPCALVPAGDDRALADSLVHLLSDRARCERAGAVGRRAALERFTPDRVADRLLGHYARVRAMSDVRQ